MATYDEQGRIINDVAESDGLGGVGDYTPWGRIGGDIWEFLHPTQVQAEYRAVGKEAPSVAEIMTGAAADIGERAAEGAAEAFNYAQKGIVLLGVAGLAYLVLTNMPKQPQKRGRG